MVNASGSRALLLGGTGAMGVYLVQYLIERGWDVTVTSRSEHPNRSYVTYVKGNAKDKAFLDGLLNSQRWDVIVDFMVWGTQEFSARYQALLGACDQYVFLSSYRAYADSPVIVEDSHRLLDVCQDKDYLATDEYALAKARQENLIRASGRDNWTIVHPSITYSKARFQICTLECEQWLWRWMRGLAIALPPEMLDKQTTLTWAGDAARFIACLCANIDALGQTVNVVTGEHMTWRQVIDIYDSILPLPVDVRPVSVEEYIDIVQMRYPVLYDRMFDRVLDNSKALRLSGLKQSDLKPLKEGLTQELKPFLESPKFRYIDPRFQARMDKATHSWSYTSAFGLKGTVEYILSRFGF